MQRPAPRPVPTHLLHYGERVEVEVTVYAPVKPNIITGAIAGFDEYGVLIDRDSGGSVFAPWMSVSTITKLTA